MAKRVMIDDQNHNRQQREQIARTILATIPDMIMAPELKQPAADLLQYVSTTPIFDYSFYDGHDKGYCPLCHDTFFRETMCTLDCSPNTHQTIQVMAVQGERWLMGRHFVKHFTDLKQKCPLHYVLYTFFSKTHPETFRRRR